MYGASRFLRILLLLFTPIHVSSCESNVVDFGFRLGKFFSLKITTLFLHLPRDPSSSSFHCVSLDSELIS